MRRPLQRAFWIVLALLLVAGAAWWTHDHWGRYAAEAAPWAQRAWVKLTRPGPDTLPADRKSSSQAGGQGARGAASAPVVPTPRKCVQDGRTTYTDQPCPPGSQEQLLDGGAVTSLPR